MMLLMNWRLTLVVLLAVVPVGIMLQVLGFALRRVWRVIRRVVSRMNVYTQEMLSGFVVVKAFTREPLCEEEYDAINQETLQIPVASSSTKSFLLPLGEFSQRAQSCTGSIVWWLPHLKGIGYRGHTGFVLPTLAYDVRPHCRFFRQVYAFPNSLRISRKDHGRHGSQGSGVQRKRLCWTTPWGRCFRFSEFCL